MRQKAILLAGLALLIAAAPAFAAEPLAGNWKTLSGDTANAAPCGDAWCIALVTGKYAGRQIGRLKGSAGSYAGELTDPVDNKTYAGTAAVAGKSLELKGCVLFVLCKSRTWTRP